MPQVLIDELRLQGQLTAQEFLQRREAVLDKLLPNSALMPGAERLVRHLAAHGVPCAVATSSHRRHFEVKSERHEQLFGLFDHIVTGDQVVNGKPHPEIFQAAAAAFKAPPAGPSACLVFEGARMCMCMCVSRARIACKLAQALTAPPTLPLVRVLMLTQMRRRACRPVSRPACT